MAQITNKEKNFVSAVVYLHDCAGQVEPFFDRLLAQLEEHFTYYEIVAVNDGCTDDTVARLKAFAAAKMEKPLTILNMSLHQGVEQAMNAGLDAAIGDFVFEFDSLDTPYPAELVWQAYEKALTGFDVVTVSPSCQKAASRAFYTLFNAFSNSVYKLESDAFRLVSRRAINRVKAISENLPYRKAAYAASGLACKTLHFEGSIRGQREARLDKAIDSLALYTNAGYKISFGISCMMAVLTLIALVYTVVVWLVGEPVTGWTTTMLVLSGGLAGMFVILTIAVKYLSLLVDLSFRKQAYLIEGIEKIQK